MLLCRLGGGGGGGGVTVRKSGGKAQGALSWLVHLRRISSIRLTGPTEAQEGGRGAWGCERRGPHGASGAAGSPQWAAATSLEDDGEYAPGAAQRIPAERTLGQTLPLSAARNPNRISTLMLKTDQDYREQGNPIYLPSNAGCDAFSTRPERRASELACAVPRRRPCAPTVRAAEESGALQKKTQEERCWRDATGPSCRCGLRCASWCSAGSTFSPDTVSLATKTLWPRCWGRGTCGARTRRASICTG